MGGVHLYLGVKRNQKLKHLYLDENNLAGRQLHELTAALWSNSAITKLSLENCNLGDQGCIYIMDGLERNGFIKDINLRKNNIRTEGAKRISLLLSG